MSHSRLQLKNRISTERLVSIVVNVLSKILYPDCHGLLVDLMYLGDAIFTSFNRQLPRIFPRLDRWLLDFEPDCKNSWMVVLMLSPVKRPNL